MESDQVARLLDPRAYPHAVTGIALHETHISWVILTGEFAYKIKKPVSFGFLDFSTLEYRKRDCAREFQLNRAFSAHLYLGVVEIRETPDHRLRVANSEGRVVEYAVKMRQFPQEALFSRMLDRGGLEPGHVEGLAERMAVLHERASAAAPESGYGGVEQVGYWSEENLSRIDAIVAAGPNRTRFLRLRDAVRAHFSDLEPILEQRVEQGRIRDCHGDLHLGNILWLDGRVQLFDRIEFNDALRWIDVINDIAFTVMDLGHRGRDDLALRFVNRYLRNGGDYAGLHVLPFYRCYRALVRAKVALLGCDDARRASVGDEPGFLSHLVIAERSLKRDMPSLTITCGLSGSGKTTRAMSDAQKIGAIVIHSDVERKRLHGLAPEESSGNGLNAGIYASGVSATVYRRLAELAGEITASGYPVIVDAAFLRRADRQRFRSLAKERGIPFRILYCEAPADELRRRIVSRLAAGDVSEATVEVLESQLKSAELPGDDELAGVRVPEGFGSGPEDPPVS